MIQRGALKVSIRARPIDRAIPRSRRTWILASKFQSAPDQLIGRYFFATAATFPARLFQSAPDQLIGRYPAALAVPLSEPVSIRARPIDRAIRQSSGALSPQYLFQSAPDQLIGRYFIKRHRPWVVNWFQSAPDQLIGRYPIPPKFHAALDRFQSAPDQLIGRYPQPACRIKDHKRFQSAPDQLIGRYVVDVQGAPTVGGFNPRPTN